MGQSSALVQITAEKIRANLSEWGESLPGIRYLSDWLNVSKSTISKALNILAEDKLIRLNPQKRAEILSGKKQENKVIPKDASYELYKELKSQILSSQFIAGEALPKRNVIADNYNISMYTVSEVYKKLLDEDLVHFSGNCYKIGKKPASNLQKSFSDNTYSNGTVLVISKHYKKSTMMLISDFDHAYLREFMNASDIHKFTILFESVYRVRDIKSYFTQLITELPNYVGTLLLGSAAGRYKPLELEMMLRPFRKPIVWYDLNRVQQKMPNNRLFYRTQLSEESSIRCALNHAVELGHQKMAFIQTEKIKWQRNRRVLLLKIFQKKLKGPAYSCYYTRNLLPEFVSKNPADFDRLIRKTHHICKSEFEKVYAKLISSLKPFAKLIQKTIPKDYQSSPYKEFFAVLNLIHVKDPEFRKVLNISSTLWSLINFYDLLENKGVTLLFSPNDIQYQQQIIKWLQFYPLPSKKRVSVISFDNRQSMLHYKLTSVDHGFGALGRSSFYCITGLQKIKINQQNEIQAVPFVVKRGSVFRG